ncbi:MAG TPA: hypothetical protein VMW58_01480 [Anaerolineae bacterium]|nr:hypothetical protein [Anaerolineae bacterium]
MPEQDFLEAKAWWEEKTKPKALDPALGIFKYFADHDSARLSAYNGYSRVYLNRDINDCDYLASYTAAWNTEDNSYSRVPVNLVKVLVDAAAARVTKQNPRPVFVTRGGNFTLQKKARQMQKWVEYSEHFTNLRPTKKEAYLDSIIYGNGFVKTAPHPVVDEITNARVHPADIYIDPMESSANASPTHLYQRAYVSRSRLMKMFPKYKDKIRTSGRITDVDAYQWRRQDQQSLNTVVEVVEGWRLPSYHGSEDGKHIIFVQNQVLVLDEWESDSFPFSCVRWKDDPTMGFWGVGLTEELLGLHYDFNHTISNIQTCVDSMPTPFILVPEGGNISEGQLGNVNGIIINYSDRAPTFELPPSVPSDVVAYMQNIWTQALQVSRLVSLGMQDVTGNGLETGQAVRDFNDIQSTELAPQYEAFERFNVDCYYAQVRAGREIYDRNPSFTVVMRKDKYTIEDVDWKNIDEDPKRDSFVIQVFPASMLSQTPAGRKSDVLDYFNAGWLDVGEAMSLLDFPDMDKFRNLRDASRQNVERILEEMLDEDKYTPPEPTLDLRLAMKMTQMYINRAQAMGVPEERVSNLRQFMRQVHTLLQKSEEATRVQAMGMGPGLAGGPPAVSPDGSMPTAIQ